MKRINLREKSDKYFDKKQVEAEKAESISAGKLIWDGIDGYMTSEELTNDIVKKLAQEGYNVSSSALPEILKNVEAQAQALDAPSTFSVVIENMRKELR